MQEVVVYIIIALTAGGVVYGLVRKKKGGKGRKNICDPCDACAGCLLKDKCTKL